MLQHESILFSVDAYDPDGQTLAYNWKLNSENVSQEQSFEFACAQGEEGLYELTLNINDNFAGSNKRKSDIQLSWHIHVDSSIDNDIPEILSLTGTNVYLYQPMELIMQVSDRSGIKQITGTYTVNGETGGDVDITIVDSLMLNNQLVYLCSGTIPAQSLPLQDSIYFKMTDNAIPENSGNSVCYPICWQERTVWEKVYGGSKADAAGVIKETADGGYAVLASSSSYVTGYLNYDIWLMKLDAAGDTLWSKFYGGNGMDCIADLVVTDDGGYIIAGSSFSFGDPEDEDIWIIKVDSKGEVIWDKIFGNNFRDSPTSMIATSDGGLIISASWSGHEIFKLDQNGDMLWNLGYDDEIYHISPTEDENYISCGSGVMADMFVMKFTPEGDVLWEKEFSGDNYYNGLTSIISTCDGLTENG